MKKLHQQVFKMVQWSTQFGERFFAAMLLMTQPVPQREKA